MKITTNHRHSPRPLAGEGPGERASRHTTPLLSALLALLLTSTASAAEPASCQTIRFAEVGWADIAATTGIAAVITEGLGYKPTKTLASVPIAFAGVGNKSIDVFLGYWMPTMDEMIEPFLKRGAVKVLEKANLEGAKYTLAVPAYTYDAGLKTFQDLARFKDQLNGKIYAIEPGNDGNRAVEDMIKRNLFDTKGFSLVESSEAGMLVQVSRAVKKQQPIVFLGWEPHPMNTQFDIRYLDGGDETLFGPNFGAAKIWTVIPPDYEARCPNIGKFLNNLQFTVGIESELMEKILEKENPNTTAANWLRAHPDWLERWLDGVTAFDGSNGLSTVKQHLGL